MKRVTILLLAIMMAVLAVAPTALAKEIQIYGDGSKTSYDIADKHGDTYHYYDIFGGATTREDTSDTSTFIRAVLNSRLSNGDTLTQFWDWVGSGDFSQGRYISLDGRGIYSRVLDMWNGYHELNNVLVESRGMEATERAIREKLAQMVQKGLKDQSINANYFKVNEALKNLDYDGMTFFTLNAAAMRGVGIEGYGSVFYDFQFAYIEDGKIADSAVGDETDIEKVRHNRGVKVDEEGYQFVQSSAVRNESSAAVERTVSFSDTRTYTMENSVSHTKETNSSLMVGTEVKTTAKIPLLGETEITVKGEYTTEWMASTTKGSSESISKSLTYSDEATCTVPARSVADISLQKADSTYSIEYDYPIAVTFKVAQFYLYNNNQSDIYAMWGEAGDLENASAVQNLRNRVKHMKEAGYEALHSSGYPMDWKPIAMGRFQAPLYTEIPMSATGGTLSVSGSKYRIVVKDPTPIDALGSLRVDGRRVFQVQANQTLDVSASAPVEALADYAQAEVPFYTFDEMAHGGWMLCDAQGNPVESDLAELGFDGARWTLRAGSETGVVYLKYQLDEAKNYQIATGEGENLVLTSVPFENDGVANDTLIAVKIVSDTPNFEGSVEIDAPAVEAVIGTPLDLGRDGPQLKFFNAQGVQIDESQVEHPEVWSLAGGNSEGASIVNNVLTVHQAGEGYQVQVSVGGAVSKPVPVKMAPGEPAAGIELDKAELRLSKGDSAALKATVLPAGASQQAVWQSMNEKVATVDAAGKVKAMGTGTTAITATTADGQFRAVCNVTVEVPADGEALDQGKVALVKGKSLKLGTPGGAGGVWTVADEGIAAINEKGKVTGKALGETTLRFTVEGVKEGAKFLGKALHSGDVVEVPVAVRDKGQVVTKVKLGDKKIALAPGENYAVAPTFKPEKAIDQEVYYKSSNKKVALVDDQGVITGVSAGKATITATSASGKTAKVTVTVSGSVSKIKLNQKKQKMVPGEVFHLIATAVPQVEGFAPVYESSKPGVATVDEEGNVTAVAKGKATITVYAAPDKKVKAKCAVTVK